MSQVLYKYAKVQGIRIFYREAGDPAKPTFVLFHGFPSSSHMYRDLILDLCDCYHVIAPDYPAFGQSDMPSREFFSYTFDHLAQVIEEFLIELKLHSYYIFVFDYGAPIGFRIALQHPERILGIVSQNGNVYEEGLGPKWAQRAEYWENPTPEKRESFKTAFAPETIYGQYTFGTQEGSVGPDGYTLDCYYMSREGEAEIQSDLIFDYQSNVALYPSFQKYLRDHQPKLLAVWGKNDPSFIYQGAEAFKKDVASARVEFVDSGHFAVETHHTEIARLIKEFFN